MFSARGIGADQLPEASAAPLPLDEAADAERANGVEQNVGAVSQGVVEYTNGVLFKDLWLRPGLAPRDRSLITVTSLISSGQVGQITYHFNRAMNAGLMKDQPPKCSRISPSIRDGRTCSRQSPSSRTYSKSGRADRAAKTSCPVRPHESRGTTLSEWLYPRSRNASTTILNAVDDWRRLG
ncbi:carboxymuconolactone decarboxylase family protein [Rhizobium leguminosarum]|uniref:carboxymuconolactone decarboxylase family protein n=1 Tax=Rhizobium leguminosarum TaxID=384 RepID=UPI0028F40111|nr:carboxymuconolactone decarboxylase family protein [Rhizobium leguminosarum]